MLITKLLLLQFEYSTEKPQTFAYTNRFIFFVVIPQCMLITIANLSGKLVNNTEKAVFMFPNRDTLSFYKWHFNFINVDVLDHIIINKPEINFDHFLRSAKLPM